MSEMEVTEGQLLSQDFGVGGPPAAAEIPLTPVDSGKTPDILAAEIRTIKNQTGRMVLNASIEVGRRLTEAKSKLPHGSWGEYLKNEVDYSPSQAQNLMRVFREYGSDQQSLFGGEAKSQTFGNLTYSKVHKHDGGKLCRLYRRKAGRSGTRRTPWRRFGWRSIGHAGAGLHQPDYDAV